MSEENGENGKKKGWWIKFIGAVAGALVALSTVGVTWYTTIRAETKEQSKQDFEAIEKGYNKLKEAINKMAEVQNKHSLWIVACQAKQEAQTATKLMAELEVARKEIERLHQRQGRRRVREDLADLRAKFELEQKRRAAEAKRREQLMQRARGDQVKVVPPMPRPKGRPKAVKGD
jgi:hypothetical protein